MAYPVDTTVETAIGVIENVLDENFKFIGNREDTALWRKLLARIELRVNDGATGYGALTQKSDSTYNAEQQFGVS